MREYFTSLTLQTELHVRTKRYARAFRDEDAGGPSRRRAVAFLLRPLRGEIMSSCRTLVLTSTVVLALLPAAAAGQTPAGDRDDHVF